ncbi:flagellar basal body rod C-terminal domain-containing protein [Caloramator sp. mosi_1]|uniref:flagellar basal body rod C-terminal domain-containing protein n=1 Tax=Caloramator sp. mosi_1 TaxID=3023090 RepID=UPI00236263B7|nr:flagellar basal body rod C-terminal domain-containing protein [Caloramator sp. mosi_1]WDC83922.1 flagellar basal body rod C-terminal domain-containing protein [Caloramator sp. mosi_1]
MATFDAIAETSDVAAKDLKLVDDIKNGKLDKINAGKTGSYSGNGERALLVGQLRNTRFNIAELKSRDDFKSKDKGVNLDLVNLKMTSNASGSTIEGYYKGTISELGVSNQEAKRMVKNQENLVDQLVIRRESVSGVSIDEEMTNMLQFQRAYEANAKMISVIDQLLDVVVNGLLRR